MHQSQHKCPVISFQPTTSERALSRERDAINKSVEESFWNERGRERERPRERSHPSQSHSTTPRSTPHSPPSAPAVLASPASSPQAAHAATATAVRNVLHALLQALLNRLDSTRALPHDELCLCHTIYLPLHARDNNNKLFSI